MRGHALSSAGCAPFAPCTCVVLVLQPLNKLRLVPSGDQSTLLAFRPEHFQGEASTASGQGGRCQCWSYTAAMGTSSTYYSLMVAAVAGGGGGKCGPECGEGEREGEGEQEGAVPRPQRSSPKLGAVRRKAADQHRDSRIQG
jgi:hypothetical protein